MKRLLISEFTYGLRYRSLASQWTRTNLIVLPMTLFIFSSCMENRVKSNLVGKWRIDKITFKTELVSSDLALGVTTNSSATINQDGPYTYNKTAR